MFLPISRLGIAQGSFCHPQKLLFHPRAIDQKRGEGGGEVRPKKWAKNGPNPYFPLLISLFSHYEIWVQGVGGGGSGGGGGGTCLSGGGGEGGRGSRGGGEGVQGEGVPPRRNVPSPQGTENLLGNEPLSTWKCHLVGSKQSQFIIAGQFRVPSSNQDTTNTTKRDIHHLMPTHSDHGQSELDSPELEPPSVVEVELEPDDDEESESLPACMGDIRQVLPLAHSKTVWHMPFVPHCMLLVSPDQ